MPPPLLGRFYKIPVDLYRVQSGMMVNLRAKKPGKIASYDLSTVIDGMVMPSKSDLYQGPNGMSLWSLNANLQEAVRTFSGRDIRIYQLPKGTDLPKDLVLLNDFFDHYSLQCDKEIHLKLLNAKLTDFLSSVCPKHMTRNEFIEKYPY